MMIARFARCTEGGIAAMTALLATVLIGVSGLGVELGYWYTVKGSMQSTADAAVMTAASAQAAGDVSYANEAYSVAAQNGWASGSGTPTLNNNCSPTTTTQVCVNSPPKYGHYTGNNGAIEVVISRAQSPFLAWAVGDSSNTGIMAHAVYAPSTSGNGCLLALGSGNSIQINGNGNLTLSGCDADGKGNISFSGNHSHMSVRSFDIAGTVSAPGQLTDTVAGKSNDANSPNDPLAHRSIGTKPATCTTLATVPATLSPGAYCGLNITSNITLNSGVYYIEGGQFSTGGPPGTTITSAAGGVTIVLTSTAAAPNTFATVNIAGNSVLNLTALTTGPTAGIVFFGDPAQTTNVTETFAGNGTDHVTGAIYFPNQTVSLSGNGSFSSPSGCFEIIAQDVIGTGNGTLSDGCIGEGLPPIGGSVAQLVE